MAAMNSSLLVRSLSSPLIRSIGSYSSSVLHLRNHRFAPFSTSSAKDLATRVESAVERSPSWRSYRDQPYLPIPDGFPFSVKDYLLETQFLRQDKDETTEIFVLLGNPPENDKESFYMSILVFRGYWQVYIQAILRSKMLRIHEAEMSENRGHHLRCYQEFLDSKGMDAKQIIGLFDLLAKVKEQKAKNILIDA